MAQQPPTFEEVLAKVRSERPRQVARKAPVAALPNVPLKFKSGSTDKPLDPISWLIDIASRPLYSVTNQASSLMDAMTKGATAERDKKRDSGDIIGAYADAANIATSGLRGFFSTNKDDKHTTSELIEQGADTAGTYDRRYKDVQDNVNPIAKGVLGLAGDIGLDPLTYFPGGAMVGIARKAASLGKKAPDAVKALAAAGKVEDVTKPLADVVPPVEKAVDNAGNPLRTVEGDEFLARMDAQRPHNTVPVAQEGGFLSPAAMPKVVVPEGASKTAFGASKAAESTIPESALKQVLGDPKINRAQKFMKSLNKADAAEKAAPVAKGVMLSKGAFLKEYAKELENATWRAADGTDVHIDAIVRNPAKYLPKVPAARVAIEKAYSAYQAGFAKSKGMVDIYGEPLVGALDTPVVGKTAFDRFQRKIAVEETAVDAEAALGTHLYNYLKKATRPDTFDNYVAEFGAMLQRGSKIDSISTKAKLANAPSALRAVIGTTDVDVLGVNAARKAGGESPVAERLSTNAKRTVNKAVKENPLGKFITMPERRAQNAAAKAAIAERKVAEEARLAKQARLAANNEQVTRIKGFLPQVIKDQFQHGMKYRTKKDIARDSEYQSYGFGINDKLLNGYAQWNIGQKAMKHWIDEAAKPLGGARGGKAHTMNGPERAAFIREGFMSDMRMIEDMLTNEGYQLWIGRTLDDAAPLSMTRVYEELLKVNPAFLKYVFNTQTAVPFTNLQRAIQAAMEGADAKTIDTILGSVAKDARLGNINNPLRDKEGLAYGFTPKRSKVDFDEWFAKEQAKVEGKGYTLKANEDKTGYFRVYDSQALRGELTETIVKASDTLRQIAIDTTEELSKRIEGDAFNLTKAEVEGLIELVDDPEKLGMALEAVAHYTDDLEDLAEWGGATADGTLRATARVGEVLDKAIVGNATGTAKAAKAAERITGKTPVDIDRAGISARRAGQQAGSDAAVEAQRAEGMFKPDPLDNEGIGAAIARAQLNHRHGTPDASWDASAKTYAEINSRIGMILDPVMRHFKADYGMENAYQVLHSFRNGSAARVSKVGREFAEAAKKYNVPLSDQMQTTVFRVAWDDWAAGRMSTNPRVAEAQAFIKNFMAGKFSGESGSLNSYSFMRTPAGIETINRTLKAMDLPQYDIAAGKLAAEANGTNPLYEIMEQVKTWEVDDPFDAMMKLYGATEQVATDAGVAFSLGASMVERSLKLPVEDKLAYKGANPPAGFKKVEFTGENRYGDMLDPDIYWSPEMQKEISILDAVSRESRMFGKEGFGHFIHNYFDPVQGAWKYAITLPRPGHHIRNMIGDWSMTYLAEGTRQYSKSNKDAWKLLSQRGKYTDLDVSKAMEHYGMNDMPRGGDVLYAPKNSKYKPLTVDQAMDGMYSHGLFNSYQGLEDLVDVSNPFIDARAAKFKKGVDTATLRGGRIEKAAAGISEGRDHLARAQHFLQYVYKAMDDNKFNGDFDTLFREAAHQVKKFHPDGSMLTTDEAKYMRRIIPFYSWLRGALPAIVEGGLTHPARANVFPKASYNLAVAMGINPDSLSNPFPEDQLFPSFLTEQTFGPQFQAPGGNYIGVNPGIAMADVGNMLLADPARGIAGSVSPLLRIGPELLSKASWGTGSQIRDTSDYLDQMIPGVNYLANMTGNSVTGSAASLLTTGKLDPQAQVAAGNKGPQDQALSLANWISGLNIQNMSRPNFINYAEIEKRNREGGPSASF